MIFCTFGASALRYVDTPRVAVGVMNFLPMTVGVALIPVTDAVMAVVILVTAAAVITAGAITTTFTKEFLFMENAAALTNSLARRIDNFGVPCNM